MSPLQVLRAARALIETPKRWTQGANARVADGRIEHDLAAPGVVCRCTIGAPLTVDGQPMHPSPSYLAVAS